MITSAVLCDKPTFIANDKKLVVMDLYESMLTFESKMAQTYSDDMELRHYFTQLQRGRVESWMKPMVVGIDSITTRPLVSLAGVH